MPQTEKSGKRIKENSTRHDPVLNIPIKLCSSSKAIIQSFKLKLKPIKAYTIKIQAKHFAKTLPV